MRSIELNPLSFIASPDEKKFILLRSEKAEDKTFLKDFATPKIIKKNNADKIPGVWGTLGYKDDKLIDWKGTIVCSNDGNNDFTENSAVKDEVDILKFMYPNIQLKGDINEKVINLNEVEIKMPEIFSLDEIPQLRLDVFLGKDEGALAFYQLQKENNNETELEFIHPQATGDYRTNNRDRLKYYFNVISNNTIEEVPDIPNKYRLSSKKNDIDFIIKVLIFKRTFKTRTDENKIPSTSTEVVKLIEEKLASYSNGLFVKDHILKIFSKNKKRFVKAEQGSIDTSKKTLLLLHGTFSSTKGSFKKGYDWISNLIAKGKYEQIIAFDHPTLFYDAEMNINVLFNELNLLGVESFKYEVDLIGTSQGGLLAQQLANVKQSSLRIGKVALLASANGVDYLSFVNNISTGLKMFRKVMRKIGLAPAALVSALFQHSFEWVLKQPGLAVMTPGKEKLNSIIYKTPAQKTTRYLPIAGNYHTEKRFKRRLEFAIDLILDEYNDWVVGTKNQFKAPSEYVAIAGYNPGKYRQFMINNAIHGSLIEKNEAHERMEQFFFNKSIESIDVTHKNAMEMFDSHCHLFGRDVISSRLMMMLLGDLTDYFISEKDKSSELLDPIILREEESSGKSNLSAIIKNIFKYFILNKGAHQMLHDLEEAYYESTSKTYRYVPLMFDLEMAFRNQYDAKNKSSLLPHSVVEFKKEHNSLIKKLDKSINIFEKKGKKIFKGTLVENEESVKLLKYGVTVLRGLEFLGESASSDVKTSYKTQIRELKQLKTIYGADVLPFLATDPRKSKMGSDIKKLVGKGKTFHGLKIYAPNGYSPTDPHLFDESMKFIDNTSLYQWCVDNNIPIIAHNSDAGFASFADKLEVYGDICTSKPGSDCTFKLEYKNKEYVDFKYNIRNGGFGKAVKEKAHILNHPCIWRKVLNKYPDLKICFAHFGGDSDTWQEEIKKLILDFDNVYTDLSCQTSQGMLQKINDRYFKIDNDENIKIRNRIMYGSDYFLNMLSGIKFEQYLNNFNSENSFSEEHLRHMSFDVPKKFLGV
jgi:predicted TIM-barrel fold metal-dependent hydrolase